MHAREAGFGLVEALVTITVLAIGVLGYAALQTSLIEHDDRAALTFYAAGLAEEKLEEIESAPPAMRASGEEAIVAATGDAFSRRWTITNATPADGLTTVSIRVQGPRGMEPVRLDKVILDAAP